MKRLTLPALVAAYVIFGAALLFQMTFLGPPSGWHIRFGEGDLVWNGWTKRMKVVVRSERMVLETPEADLGRFEIVRKVPGATVFLKVTGGNPSRLHEPLSAEGGLTLVNPAGVIVGPGAVLDVGGRSPLSTLDLERDFENEPIGGDIELLGNFLPKKDLQSSSVELKANGNVYGLAIKKDGKIQASGASVPATSSTTDK